MSPGTGSPSSSSTVGATSSRCASSVPRASTPAPAAIQSPSWAWFASSGPGVVLERVDALVAADRPDRAPEQVAEEDDQVGRDALDLGVELLRLVDPRRERAAPVVGDRREPARRARRGRARSRPPGSCPRARAPDVEEDAGVVAALAPGGRARQSMPACGGELTPSGSACIASSPSRRSHSLMRMPPSSRLAPWSETTRTSVSSSACAQQAADQPVDVLVVVEDRVLVGVAGLVLAVLGVHVLPEAVVHAVGAHLDHREELPRLRREQVLGEREALVGHLVDLAQQVVLVVGAELRAVEQVLADDLADLVAQRGRERVPALERRRQEAADHGAAQRARRERARHAEDDRAAAAAADEIPEARRPDRRAVRDEGAVVGVVGAVAEAVDAEVARRAARHHAGPGRHGDRRHHRREAPGDAALGEPGQHREPVAPALEHERRLGAIQPDDDRLLCGRLPHGDPC